MNDKQIIKKLTEELEQATRPKWISVEDKLPSHNGSKGCNLGDSVIVDIYADGERWCDCYYNFDDNVWFDTDVHCSIDNVTHWVLRPEPPQE